jgi:pyruvate/2-oxoglutarate dehydrogenase complex dihydrolipoamide dehydrogenase (E3) component
MSEVVKTDVLVIGGGGAGGRAAVEASEYKVNVTIANKGIFHGMRFIETITSKRTQLFKKFFCL